LSAPKKRKDGDAKEVGVRNPMESVNPSFQMNRQILSRNVHLIGHQLCNLYTS